MVKALLPLPSWNSFCSRLETTKSYQPRGFPVWPNFVTARRQDRWPCIDTDLPGQGWGDTQADSSSHPQWQCHISSRASPGAWRGCGTTETHKRSHICLMDFSADLTNLQSFSSWVHQLQNRSTQMLACLCSACYSSNEAGTHFKQRVQINFPS